MNFDDYNYNMYNKFILIDPDQNENDPNAVGLGEFQP